MSIARKFVRNLIIAAFLRFSGRLQRSRTNSAQATGHDMAVIQSRLCLLEPLSTLQYKIQFSTIPRSIPNCRTRSDANNPDLPLHKISLPCTFTQVDSQPHRGTLPAIFPISSPHLQPPRANNDVDPQSQNHHPLS